MKVVLIGSGNVATVLGKKIVGAGHKVVQVVSRKIENARLLAAALNTTAVSSLSQIIKEADIYIVSVADDMVEKLAADLNLQSQLVVHTAGALSKDVLKNASTNYGVLYPLQSLRKEMVTMPQIPLLLDGSSEAVVNALQKFAATLSDQVAECGDQQRLKLHVAAVFSSNFTNHLYAIAENYCKKEGLTFDMLKPLILETAERLAVYSPKEMQTGPASRRDHKTILRHQEYLRKYPEYLKVYDCLTESIMTGE